MKEPLMSGSGILWAYFEQIYERNPRVFQRVAQRYVGGFFVIKLSICPLGILRLKWWALFE